MRQPSHFILQMQLAPLEFRQGGIVHGWMLEGFGKLVLDHGMLLGGPIYSLTMTHSSVEFGRDWGTWGIEHDVGGWLATSGFSWNVR
jgi:hypothetical protein